MGALTGRPLNLGGHLLRLTLESGQPNKKDSEGAASSQGWPAVRGGLAFSQDFVKVVVSPFHYNSVNVRCLGFKLCLLLHLE